MPILFAALLVLGGCDKVDPDSPLGQRQAIFRQMLKTSEDLGGMLRGRLQFEADAFASGAARLDELSHQPWRHFPTVKEEHSSARDEVWRRQARFDQLARQLEGRSAALAAISSARPLAAEMVAAPLQKVEDACAACHREFRDY
jgi:cytochrome c556